LALVIDQGDCTAIAVNFRTCASDGSLHGTVRIWEPDTCTRRHTLTGHTDAVAVVAIAPDSTWLATAGDYDGTVRIWDPVTGTQRHTLTGHTDAVAAVAIAPDGTWLATAGRSPSAIPRLP
jgi:WD40 repeat protein